MKISVVTPSYNQGRFIEDAINSVLDQHYPDFEHIIIDGGSTDDTVDRLKRYPHLKWISEKDDGQSDALNKGFKMATGDIVCWLNADDFYTTGTFQKVNQFLSDDKLDGVYSNILFCDKNRFIVGKKTSHRPIKFFTVWHCYIPSESLFFKRKLLEQQNFVDKDFHITMDKEFIARILYGGFRLKYIKEVFAVFRRHESNKSLNTKETQLTSAREGLTILNRYWKTSFPVSKSYIKLYRAISLMILPVRKIFFERIGI